MYFRSINLVSKLRRVIYWASAMITWNLIYSVMERTWTHQYLASREQSFRSSTVICREGRDVGLFITLVPQIYNNVFLFVCLTTLGTFLEFDCFVHYVKCSNVSTTNCNVKKGKFCLSSMGMYINLSAIFLSFYISG